MIARIMLTIDITKPDIEIGVDMIKIIRALSTVSPYPSSPARKDITDAKQDTTVNITQSHQYDAMNIIYFSFKFKLRLGRALVKR
jgi:hypothetical protein